MATGDTVVMDAGAFDPDRVLGLIERERITSWAVVPTMARRILDPTAGYDLGSLAALSINSAPSAPALKTAVQVAVPSVQAAVVDTYGLTESGTAATLTGALDGTRTCRRPPSSGSTMPISVRWSRRSSSARRPLRSCAPSSPTGSPTTRCRRSGAARRRRSPRTATGKVIVRRCVVDSPSLAEPISRRGGAGRSRPA